MSDVTSVLFVGVGGQGTILASKILTIGLIEHGYDVKMSEVHGMSQRGGSVSTQVRFGKKVYSPIIGEGSADILVSFEEMEAARYARFLKKGGKMVVNTTQIPSLPVLSGACQYPQGIIAELKKHVPSGTSMRRKSPPTWAIPRVPTSSSWAPSSKPWASMISIGRASLPKQ